MLPMEIQLPRDLDVGLGISMHIGPLGQLI
jgi:hypothetical protein